MKLVQKLALSASERYLRPRWMHNPINSPAIVPVLTKTAFAPTENCQEEMLQPLYLFSARGQGERKLRVWRAISYLRLARWPFNMGRP